MRIIAFINLTLFALTILTVGLSVTLFNKGVSQENHYLMPPEPSFPKSPFPQNETNFTQGPFSLKWTSPQSMLPDLKQEVTYLGKNHRPDVQEGKSRFYISIGKNKDPILAESGEKLYLTYSQSGAYSPSFDNMETPLWLEMVPMMTDRTGEEYLEVKAYLLDEEGLLITYPSNHHLFTLKMEERKGGGATPWELSGLRVDGSLLIRQGARLTGKDLFLEMHGGDPFKDILDRDRLDFLSGDNPYCCFIKEGDFLIWKDKQWQRAGKDDETSHYPLLAIKKLDEKSLSVELWDIEGKNKFLLSLPRSKNFDPPLDLNQEFKLVGAKTWIECVVECRGKRFLVKEGDWMVLTPDGWHKIASEKEVDDFVDQKMSGPLFILDKITKKNSRTTLVGHLFNALRTSVADIELANQETILKGELE